MAFSNQRVLLGLVIFTSFRPVIFSPPLSSFLLPVSLLLHATFALLSSLQKQPHHLIMSAPPQGDLISNGLDGKIGTFREGTDLALLQAASSIGGASLHLMDEAAYLNPDTVGFRPRRGTV